MSATSVANLINRRRGIMPRVSVVNQLSPSGFVARVSRSLTHHICKAQHSIAKTNIRARDNVNSPNLVPVCWPINFYKS